MLPKRFRLLPVLVLCGCATSESVSEGPLEVLRRQQAAWNQGDIDAFMEGYRRSPETTFSSAEGVKRGWDTVLERYRQRYPDKEAMGNVLFDDFEVTPLGKDSTLVKGHWLLQRETEPLEGVFSLIFVRYSEGWKIIHDHTSAFPSR